MDACYWIVGSWNTVGESLNVDTLKGNLHEKKIQTGYVELLMIVLCDSTENIRSFSSDKTF